MGIVETVICFVGNRGDFGGLCVNGIFLFLCWGGGSGLWRISVGVEGLSPLVFVILYGGTKILELLVGGRLVILFVFPP